MEYTIFMVIGIDGSRAFIQNRTGTENYSYQLIRHMADYFQPAKTRFSQNLDEAAGKNLPKDTTDLQSGVIHIQDLPTVLKDYPDLKTDDTQFVIYLRPGNKVNKAEWPDNFRFKQIGYKYLWTQLGLALATFTDSLDILFVPAHTIPLVRRPGLKTVMTVHDLGAEYLPASHQLKQRLYLSFITKFQLTTATHLIAVSQATKADIVKKLAIAQNRITVIYEGLNQSAAVNKDTLDSILNKFDISKDKYFFFVGTIQPRKNLVALIRAFHQLINEIDPTSSSLGLTRGSQDSRVRGNGIKKSDKNDLKLVIAGGAGWDYQSIYDLPKQLGIEDRVIFTGRVDDQQLSALYKGALALTYPSLFEGFGLPILEAFSQGCPVLTSNVSSMPEVAGKAAILVDPEDDSAIVQGMKTILKHQVREKLVAEGYRQVENFNWDKAALETLQLLQKVAQHR